MWALVLPVGPTDQPQQIEGGFPALQGIVGGDVEPVKLDPYARMYVHEDGRRLGLPVNPLATAVARRCGWGFAGAQAGSDGTALVGAAVVVGIGSDGDDTDCPTYMQMLIANVRDELSAAEPPPLPSGWSKADRVEVHRLRTEFIAAGKSPGTAMRNAYRTYYQQTGKVTSHGSAGYAAGHRCDVCTASEHSRRNAR